MEMILLTVTLVSLTVAVAMSILTWRLLREERRRSEARIAALAAAINEAEPTIAVADDDLPFRARPAASEGTMFAAAQPAASPVRFAGVIAAGALVVAAVIGAVIMLSGSRSPSAPAPPASAAREAPEMPLELVALGHERDANRLTVRGVVRNPPAGTDVTQLTAVVLLFNHDGGLVASGRAAVEGANTAPGAERTFIVSVPAGADIGRYRVSFRNDDQVIPHVDRRS
jgi:hypothetical protein